MEVLSQKEVDELLTALASGRLGGTSDQGQGALKASVRAYDFRRPDKFSKDQLRTLQMVHESFARLWTTALSAHLRAMTKVTLEQVEQLTYDEFLLGVSNPGVLCLANLDPLPGRQMIDVHPRLAFPVIDRLMGGLGTGDVGDRALTEIETTVLEKVMDGFLSSLAESWHGLASLRPRLEGVETNPLFAQVIPPNEVAAVMTFSVHLQETGGTLRLCFPFSSLQPVLPQLSAHRWTGGNGAPSAGSDAARLADVRVEMRVELGRSTLTIGQLLELEPGDVIRLQHPVDKPLLALLGPRAAFRVRPGRVGNRMATQVVEVLRGNGEEELDG